METRVEKEVQLIRGVFEKLDKEKNTLSNDFDLNNIKSLEVATLTSDALIDEIYNDIIMCRTTIIDKAKNISSQLISINDGQTIWARSVNNSLEKNDNAALNLENSNVYNYLRFFYAYLIATITIARINHCDDVNFLQTINQIRKNIVDAFVKTETLDTTKLISIISEGKGYLINALATFCKNLDKKTINEQLDQAKDWAALENPSIPIVTIIPLDKNFQDKTIIILDEPHTQLTQEQKTQFENLSQQKWYNELPLFQQQIISHYKDKIISGKCVIPSQLRAIVPACKNAYKQTIILQSSLNNFEIINSYYHSGTVAHLNKKNTNTAIEITKKNLEQQKQFGENNSSVMICLNSYIADSFVGTYEYLMGHDYRADDSDIINLTYAATQQLTKEKIYYSKICLNGFNRLELNDYSGINKIVTEIQNGINAANKLNICPNTINEMQSLIKKIYALEWQYSGSLKLDILFYFTKLVTLNNQLASTYPAQFLLAAVWLGCASGENRTGIAYYNNICLSIIDYFEKTFGQILDKTARKIIFNAVADSEHIHITTGFQGNTFGTEGIREKSSGTMTEEHAKSLVTLNSDMKSLPVQDSNFNVIMERLKLAIETAEQQPAAKTLLVPAKKLYELAANQIKTIFFMSQTEHKILVKAICAAKEILAEPYPAIPLLNILMTLPSQPPLWLTETLNQLRALNMAADPIRKKMQDAINTQSLFSPANNNVNTVSNDVNMYATLGDPLQQSLNSGGDINYTL